MASLTQTSPGVIVNEIDLTNFAPNVGVSGGAFVGQFEWGPVLDYTDVTSSNALANIFGKPTDENYIDWFSVSNFLAYTDKCTVIRVVHNENGVETAGNAVANINPQATWASNFLGPLIKNDADFQIKYTASSLNQYAFAAKYAGKLGNSLRVIVVDASTWNLLDPMYQKVFDFAPGTSEYAASIGAKNDEVHVLVIDQQGLFTGIPGTILEKYSFLSKASDGKSNDNSPSFFGNVINQKSNYIRYLRSNYAPSILVAGYYVDSAIVTTDNSRTVESIQLNNVGGTGYAVGEIITFTAGSLPNSVPATARISSVDQNGAILAATLISGGSGYAPTDHVVAASIATASGNGANLSNIVGVLSSGTIGGSGYAIGDIVKFTNPSSGKRAIGKVTAVDANGVIQSVSIVDGGSGYTEGQSVTAVEIVSNHGTGADPTNIVGVLSQNPMTLWEKPLIDQTTGVVSYYAPLINVYDSMFFGGNNGGMLDAGDLIEGWNMFRNSEEVDVSLLFAGDAGDRMTGSLTAETVINYVITNIVDQRKDCIFMFSPRYNDVVNQTKEQATENVIKFRNSLETNSSYAVMDSGWKLQYDIYADKYRWVPLNADIAGLCALIDTNADPWVSPAGFTKGKIKNVVALAYNPDKSQRDDLYSNNINPVVSFKGDGVVLYGDKTLQAKASAFQYINVRRLFLVLEKAISRAAKYQLFEFNDPFTRAQFKNMVEPYLREVKGRRGITDYYVVCDETNNTPEVIDRAEFVASIFIKPNRSINYITLNFVAVRTGVSFSEVIGQV